MPRPLNISNEEIRACPLYQWELGTRLPWWKRGVVPLWLTIPFGVVVTASVWYAPYLGVYQGAVEQLLMVLACSFIAVLYIRVYSRFHRLLDRSEFKDLLLSGQPPQVILKAFSQAHKKLAPFTIGPILPAIVLFMLDMSLNFAGRRLSHALVLVAYLAFFAMIDFLEPRIVKRRLTHFEAILVNSKQNLNPSQRLLLPIGFIVGVIYFSASPVFWIIGIVVIIVSVGVGTRDERLRILPPDALDAYLEALFKGENPDWRDYEEKKGAA